MKVTMYDILETTVFVTIFALLCVGLYQYIAAF